MTNETKELEKAVKRLKEALDQPKDEFIRDSVIQRFEFCVELSWKTARRLMGTSTTAPREVIREMGQNAYIDDVPEWLKAIEMRNLSFHTYKEELAEKVYNFVKEFFPKFESLSEYLRKK